MDVPKPPVPRLFTATPPDMYPATPMSSPPATGHDWSHSGYGPASPPAVAPELAAAMAETRTIRESLASLCCQFGPSPQSGQSARISLTVLNRHRKAAGLGPLHPSQHDRVPDALMRLSAAVDGEREIADTARRERDEARAYSRSLAEDLDDAAGHIEAWKHEAQSLGRERDEARQQLTQAGQLALEAAGTISDYRDALCAMQAERDEARADLEAARTNHGAILRDVQESEQEQRDEARRLRAELARSQDENRAMAERNVAVTNQLGRYRDALRQVKRTAEYFGHKGELDIACDALGDDQ